jgi:hypothetical protein
VQREVGERRYTNRGGKYDKYFEVLEKSPILKIKNEASKELKSVNELVGSRFVSVSRQYMRFVESEEKKRGSYSEEERSERLFEAFFNARAEVAVHSEKVRDLEKQLAENKALTERMRKAIQAVRYLSAVMHRIKTGAKGVLGRFGDKV